MMHYFIADIVPVRNQMIRMSDERYRIRKIVHTTPSISAGMAEWGAYCQSIHANLIWELFYSIDYELDLEPVTHWLQTLLTQNPPPSDVGLYYFGMFTPLDGAPRYDLVFYGLSEGAYWAAESALRYNKGAAQRYANSRVLEQIYQVSADPVYDGVIARFSELYSFLLIKAVFRQIPPQVYLRDKPSVRVGVGWCPDLWKIGRLTPQGWEDLVLPPRVSLQLDDCCGVISGQIHAHYEGEWFSYRNTQGQWVTSYLEPSPPRFPYFLLKRVGSKS